MSSHSICNPEPVPMENSRTEIIEIPLTSQQARAILKHNNSPRILVMCRGYNEDTEQFTELAWPDDADLDFEDEVSYPEFQLWVSL